MKATLMIDSWAGKSRYPVEIVAETPQRYKVKLLAPTRLPGRNKSGQAGDVVLVPKYAVKLDDHAPMH